MKARARITTDQDQFRRLGIAPVTHAFETWSDLAADEQRELVKSSVLSTVSALCQVAREARTVNKGFGPKQAEATIKWLASKEQRLVQENAPLGGKRPIFLAKDPPIAR
jgi:hypothetical protein